MMTTALKRSGEVMCSSYLMKEMITLCVCASVCLYLTERIV